MRCYFFAKKSKKGVDIGGDVRYNGESLSKSPFCDLYKSDESEELFEVALGGRKYLSTTL